MYYIVFKEKCKAAQGSAGASDFEPQSASGAHCFFSDDGQAVGEKTITFSAAGLEPENRIFRFVFILRRECALCFICLLSPWPALQMSEI